jgi:hypothetical protein
MRLKNDLDKLLRLNAVGVFLIGKNLAVSTKFARKGWVSSRETVIIILLFFIQYGKPGPFFLAVILLLFLQRVTNL